MLKMVQSADNPAYKKAKKLKQKKYRLKMDLYLLEGEKPILEALKAGQEPEGLFLRADSPLAFLFTEGGDLAAYADQVLVLREGLFSGLAQTKAPQDLIMVGRRVLYGLEDLSMREDLLILDGLQDPGNLGTIIRTSLASGLRRIILMPGTLDPYNAKVLRASAGAFFKAVFYQVKEGERDALLAALKDLGTELICADGGGAVPLFSLEKTGPQALVVGNENKGPSELFKKEASQLVSIPMPGGTESLNAAVAASLVLYEMLRLGKGS